MEQESLNRLLENEKEISYDECWRIWEDKNTVVHNDTSERVVKEVTDHIINRCKLKKTDNLLNIGCGDGLFDRTIVGNVNTFCGVDFSSQKLEIARQNVTNGHYYQHNFLNKYSMDIQDADINKIYSYSVVQYCKPEDLDTFIYNQLCLCDKDRDYIIAHLDIPDKAKAIHYYRSRIPDVTEEEIRKNVKTLFGDGSYWHDMTDFVAIAKKYNLNCQILNAHYWKYRTDIVYTFNGKDRRNIF